MHSIGNIIRIGSERWIVTYTIPVRIGCCGIKDEHHNLIIKSKNKPTKKRIDNEIKNQRSRV